ncbi:hypothetical protein BaRGS_00026177 [Batillaria attramentaria]|uniref:Uncharacterized protein n=1 Tax=Batillaria attramentaria TaxID=370345 RepID=A0ABD0K6I9_9CAEN
MARSSNSTVHRSGRPVLNQAREYVISSAGGEKSRQLSRLCRLTLEASMFVDNEEASSREAGRCRGHAKNAYGRLLVAYLHACLPLCRGLGERWLSPTLTRMLHHMPEYIGHQAAWAREYDLRHPF